MVRKTKEAFLWIINVLKKKKIPYRITGGFAAIIYGSKRSLADIDIEIHDRDFKKIFPYITNFILKGSLTYKDSEFDVYIVNLQYKGQKIDISGTDTLKIFDKKYKKWKKENISFKKIIRKKVYGLYVNVIPLENLINYKKRISRKVDLEDIRQLTKNQTNPT